MTFDDIPAGAPIFIDANCLIYAATSDPTYGSACQRLLEQIENKHLLGYTSAHVLGDFSHRLMTIEAALSRARPMTGIANWLRRHPAEIQLLTRYRLALDDLLGIPLTILPVAATHVSRAADFCRRHGLLTNDALILAIMRDHGLHNLASNDTDFDRIPGIVRFGPV